MEVWKWRLAEFSTELVNIAFGDCVFAVSNCLDFEPEVGAPENVNVNKYVSGRRLRRSVFTNSRVRVASIISAWHVHSERTMEEMRPTAEGGSGAGWRRRGKCEIRKKVSDEVRFSTKCGR